MNCPDYSDWSPRKLSFAEARDEQLRFSAGLSVRERLHAMTELNRRMYLLRGIELADSETDWTASRVRRGRR